MRYFSPGSWIAVLLKEDKYICTGPSESNESFTAEHFTVLYVYQRVEDIFVDSPPGSSFRVPMKRIPTAIHGGRSRLPYS
jgi:hypothetical protein